jgi:hypothetical protein
MTECDKFIRHLHTSFPAEPLPERFFWAASDHPIEGDIPNELSTRIMGRRWTELTIMDWMMTGAPPVIARSYLEPATFVYYLPSLLIDIFDKPEYFEMAVDCMLPNNVTRTPRGNWWREFTRSISADQRIALSVFVGLVRLLLWESIGEEGQARVHDAEIFWSAVGDTPESA